MKQFDKNFNKKAFIQGAPLAAMGALLSLSMGGCGTSSNSPPSSGVSVSGTLAPTAASLAKYQIRGRSLGNSDELTSKALALSNLKLSCVTPTSPPVQYTGTVAASGAFSLSIPSGLNQSLTCDILNANGSVAANLLVQDSAHPDMNGNPSVNAAPSYTGNSAALGSITLDTTTGDAIVPSTQATGVTAGNASFSGAPFDPTGSWTIAAVDFTLPTGVQSVCAANSNTCNGPPAGQGLYLNRLTGKSSVDQSTIYGLQVWQSSSGTAKSSMDACGDMTGLSAAEAATAKVDLSSYGNFNGPFTFATSVTDPNTKATATISNGYQLSTATAAYTMQNCVSKPVTVSAGVVETANVCGPDTAGNGSVGGLYQANLSGGCVDSTGTPFNVASWSNMVFGSCSTAAASVTGFYTNTCSAVYNGTTNLTCTNTFGVFKDVGMATVASGGTATAAPAFNFNGVATSMTQGALCSSINATTYPLAQAQCYSQYYQQYQSKLAGCLPKVQTNWNATTAAGFASVDFRPSALVFMDQLKYGSANTASMLTEQNQYQGVQVQNSSGQSTFINCATVTKGGLSFVKKNDSQILATYTASTTTSSIDLPVCVATYGSTHSKFVFYLNKN